MKTELVSYPRPTQMPTTKHDWQLYTDMPEAASVAVKLTAALRRLIRTTPPEQLAHGWAEFTKVQDAFAKYGASDTEPRQVAIAVLQQVYGVEVIAHHIGY